MQIHLTVMDNINELLFTLRLNHIISILVVILFVSCSEAEKREEFNNSVYLEGIIKGGINSFNLSKRDVISDESENYFIEIDSTGCFNYTLPVDYPQTVYMHLQTNGNIPSFFVFPSDTISIEFKDSLIFNYTDKKHQIFNKNLGALTSTIHEKIRELLGSMEFREISEVELKSRIDSVKKYLDEALQAMSIKKELSEDFINLAKNEINFYLISSVADYEYLNEIVFNQKRDIPDSYYSKTRTIASEYDTLIFTHGAHTFFNRMQMRYLNKNIEDILSIKPSLTRDILLCRVINYSITKKDFKEARFLIEKYSPLISNNYLKQEIKNRFEISYAIFQDPANEAATLRAIRSDDKSGILNELINSFPNKVLYLKFWVPYCGPCMSQLPYVKQLEEKFNSNDFQVINLCAPYPRDNWRATIKERNIAGYHYLLNDNQYNALRASLNFQGIPRYVLINKNGDIINDDAPVPGVARMGLNYDLVNQIRELIDDR